MSVTLSQAMLFFQALSTIYDLAMKLVEEIEARVPGDTHGSAKLDMWLKTILSFGEEVERFRDVLPAVAAFCKSVYNIAQQFKSAAKA
jgi:hypothetical protein